MAQELGSWDQKAITYLNKFFQKMLTVSLHSKNMIASNSMSFWCLAGDKLYRHKCAETSLTRHTNKHNLKENKYIHSKTALTWQDVSYPTQCLTWHGTIIEVHIHPRAGMGTLLLTPLAKQSPRGIRWNCWNNVKKYIF